MKKELRDFCSQIGIECVGIASAEPYLDFEKAWKTQLAKGYISGFEEKNIEKRVFPELTLEGARSVIVCIFPYYTGSSDDSNLTKSAWSIDYHLIVRDKLEAIAVFLKSILNDFKYKAFVDNGPFSDRYLAWKAGLGFWGINNHIITEPYGSYVFIGYIINNYPFEADKPQQRTCMQCLECVRNCPGKCIQGDFTINPQRCKSYITQKKKELSEDEIEILGKNRLIWGCDVCQDVCPHNRSVSYTGIDEFKMDVKCRLHYDELSGISNKEFAAKFKNRSYSWRGKSVLKRNHEIINHQIPP